MRNVYVMIVITILFFLVSFDLLFETNVYLDITLVLIYVLLVGRLALNLDSKRDKGKEMFILSEKKTSYFAPMIIMPFLGLAYSFGTIFFLINILVIVLLYVYVFFSIKRNNITVTNDDISVVYLNNKKDSMLFREVTKVEFNWVYNYIGLINSEDKKLILDITLKDFVVVIDAIKEKLPPKMSSAAFNKLAKFYTAFLFKSNIKYLK